jgi:hypothetical protein
MLFPQAAIEILRAACWSAEATRGYEIFSGGFYWSDEGLEEAARFCDDNWAYREVIGYRASLIQGLPRRELFLPWEQLQNECPNWPGFRSERCAPALAAELDQASQNAMAELDEVDRECNSANEAKQS